MKPLLLILTFSILLSSCYTFQYATIDAERTTRDEQKHIVWENDTVKLVYNFNGKWGKADISMYNKSEQPLFINWKKSAFIIDDKPYTLYNGMVQITGTATQSINNFIPVDTPTANINASFKMPEGINFLPPKTNLEHLQINIPTSVGLPSLPDTLPMVNHKTESGSKISYRQSDYSITSSPYKFKLYLTFGMGKENKEFAVEHLFYVKEIIQSANGPYVFFAFKGQKAGDLFYTSIP